MVVTQLQLHTSQLLGNDRGSAHAGGGQGRSGELAASEVRKEFFLKPEEHVVLKENHPRLRCLFSSSYLSCINKDQRGWPYLNNEA